MPMSMWHPSGKIDENAKVSLVRQSESFIYTGCYIYQAPQAPHIKMSSRISDKGKGVKRTRRVERWLASIVQDKEVLQYYEPHGPPRSLGLGHTEIASSDLKSPDDIPDIRECCLHVRYQLNGGYVHCVVWSRGAIADTLSGMFVGFDDEIVILQTTRRQIFRLPLRYIELHSFLVWVTNREERGPIFKRNIRGMSHFLLGLFEETMRENGSVDDFMRCVLSRVSQQTVNRFCRRWIPDWLKDEEGMYESMMEDLGDFGTLSADRGDVAIPIKALC
jgi:hypothetical protein